MDTRSKKRFTLDPLPSAPRRYAYVKAVMLYWEATHSWEAKEMKSIFKNLNFETELYSIPKDDSQDNVRAVILQQQQHLSLQQRLLGAPCLLIIYYSGHGERPDYLYNTRHEYSKGQGVSWRP
jgi:hypothetical protein